MLSLFMPLLLTLLLPTLKSKNSWHISIASLMLLSLWTTLKFLPMEFYPQVPSVSILMNDALSVPLVILTLWISSLMLLASYSILMKSSSKFYFMFLVLTLNLILAFTFSASNLLLFYILFEASLIPTVLIILGWGYQPERLQASFYMMLYTVSASLPLLMAILYSFNSSQSLSFSILYTMNAPSPSLSFVYSLMLTFAFFVKMPLYTTHLWLPKAHVEAPVAGSMILAGILLKLGAYGIIRTASMATFMCTSLSSIIISLSMWGAVITSMICIRQTDLKSLIAYSSVGHMGLLTAGLMTNSSWGWEGSLTMMLAHGLCSSALFALANMTYESTNTRSLFLTKGLLMYFPAMSFWWFIFAAGDMAAPTSMNLLGEILLLTSVLSVSSFMVMPIGLISFLAAAYSLYLFTATQHGAFPKFSNPMALYMTRNYYILTLHSIPLYLLVLKVDFISNWLF
uniref:NADH-ubiquinone oxidoreductase chain 4 n=1 Tax=Pectinaria gouldii TaxID=260746 RepID=G8XXJ5_PECGU|nr:NADH dehydrogenase subunit 4 [Pectinaria gouldii]